MSDIYYIKMSNGEDVVATVLEEDEDFESTERGSGGFGSTGN